MQGTPALRTLRHAERYCLDYDLGVRHGDTNRFNFLVRDSKATLIDFDTAQKCDDRNLLLQEFENLTECLKDPSGRGGGGLL